MANSDNVLRGGLTPKHVDVPELLRVLDFAPTPKARLRPPIRREGLGLVFETPTDEFAATLLVLDGDHLATRSTRRPAMTVHRSCYAPRVRRRCTGSAGRSRYSAARPPGWRPTTARSG